MFRYIPQSIYICEKCHKQPYEDDQFLICTNCQKFVIHQSCWRKYYKSDTFYICSACSNPYTRIYTLYNKLINYKKDLVLFKYPQHPIKMLIDIISKYENYPAIVIYPENNNNNNNDINKFKIGTNQV